MRIRKFFIIFITLCTYLMYIPTFHVQANSSDTTIDYRRETTKFLEWYENNKNIDYAQYTLRGNLYFESGTQQNPIVLDGNGDITIDCNGYSIYIRSNVIIDNKEMIITTSFQAKNPILVVEDGGLEANLTLKNGYVAGNSTALFVASGNIICPTGTNSFIFVGGNTAIDIKVENIILRNLEVVAEGEGDVIAVKAKSNVQIENSTIEAKRREESSIESLLVGVYAHNKVVLANSLVTVKGQRAKSVMSENGIHNVQVDDHSVFIPNLDIGEKEDDIYTVTKVLNMDTIYVPQGMDIQQLILPETLECELTFLVGQKENIKNINLNVHWDLGDLKLDEQGEFNITGAFDKNQLSNLHIYKESSFQPQIKIAITKKDWLNTFYLTKIAVEKETPYVEAYLFYPYGAKSVKLQYSEDEKTWEDGYCLRTDGKKDANLFVQKEPLRSQITTKVYFSNLIYGGRMRLVVEGGPYEGVWDGVILEKEMIFTPPGEDGSGGNRGGGGQNEGTREKPIIAQEESTVSIVSDTSISLNKVEIKHQADAQSKTSSVNKIERFGREKKYYINIIGVVVGLGMISIAIIFLYQHSKEKGRKM